MRSVYDAKTPADEFGTMYCGTLFYVLQDEDYSMSAQEFDENSNLAGMGRYLCATENTTYAIMYVTDVEFDPDDPTQAKEYDDLFNTVDEIKISVNGILGQ